MISRFSALCFAQHNYKNSVPLHIHISRVKVKSFELNLKDYPHCIKMLKDKSHACYHSWFESHF